MDNSIQRQQKIENHLGVNGFSKLLDLFLSKGSFQLGDKNERERERESERQREIEREREREGVREIYRQRDRERELERESKT